MRKVSRSCEILPITRKPFCVRNTVYSSLNSGAPLDSIHCMKKPCRLSGALLGDFAEVFGAGALPGVGGEKLFQEDAEFVVAHHLAHHAQHRRALGAGDRPILGRIVLEPGRLRHRRIVDGERFHIHVLHFGFVRGRARFLLDPEHLGVARTGVREPDVIARGRRDVESPPLARGLIDQEPRVGRVGDGARAQEDECPARRSRWARRLRFRPGSDWLAARCRRCGVRNVITFAISVV